MTRATDSTIGGVTNFRWRLERVADLLLWSRSVGSTISQGAPAILNDVGKIGRKLLLGNPIPSES